MLIPEVGALLEVQYVLESIGFRCVALPLRSQSPQESCRDRRGSGRWRLWPLVCLALLLGAPAVLPAAEPDPYRLFEQGKESLRDAKYDKALKAFSRALLFLKADERNAQVVLLARARAYYKMGELKSSWKDIRRVLSFAELDGATRASAMQLRGMINLRRKRDRRALKDFTSAIKAPHDDMELRSLSFANRGITFLRLREYDKAVSDFNKAIRLNNKSAFAYAGRALAYLRNDDIEKARRDANRALKMDPDERTAKVARKVLTSLSVLFSGPDRVSIPIGDHGHIYVQLRFGRDGKLHRFLLDTGATHTLVSHALLKRIQEETEVKKIGMGKVMTADGSTHLVTRYLAKDAFLFNLPLGDVELHVFTGTRRNSSNLLGANSLRNVSLSIDTAARKAEIRRLDSD